MNKIEEKDLEGIVREASRLAPGRGLDIAGSISLVRDSIERYYLDGSSGDRDSIDLNQLVQEAGEKGASFYFSYRVNEDYNFVDTKGFRDKKDLWERYNPQSSKLMCRVVGHLGATHIKTDAINAINEALILRPLSKQLSEITENGTEEPAYEVTYQGDFGNDPWGRPAQGKWISLITSEQKAKEIAGTITEHPEKANEAFENLFKDVTDKMDVRYNGRIVIANRDEVGKIAPKLLTESRSYNFSEDERVSYIKALEQAGLVRTYQVPSK